MESHPVEAGVPQGSPESLILLAINTSGLTKWVKEEVLPAEGLSLMDNHGWVATENDVHDIITILERCSEQHPVGKQTRATVRQRKNRDSTIRMQTRPYKTPLAKTDITVKGPIQFHTVQQTGDMLARRLDGLEPDAHGAQQLTREESQGIRP